MLEEMTNAYKILVKEHKMKRLLWQNRHGREGKIKIHLILKVLDSVAYPGILFAGGGGGG